MPQPNPFAIETVLSLDALTWAWLRVRSRNGAPGGDRVSLRRFGRAIESNLLLLAESVMDGSYTPGPVRFVDVVAAGKIRRLAILPIRDRVLQRAILDVLDPVADPRMLPSSFGYRRGLSLHDAVDTILDLRDRDHRWVIDADITRCFDSLDHGIVRESLHRLVPGVPTWMRHLFDIWLAWPPGRLRDGTTRSRKRGILQGAPLSPFLCNCVLHRFDQSMERRGHQVVRYADDFVVLCRSARQAERTLRDVEKVLAGLDLQLH